MKINQIRLSRLPNAEYFQLHTEFKRLVEVFTSEALKVAALFAAYLLSFAKMDLAYKKIIKSPITKPIHEADKARDEIWGGFMDAISAASKHFDPLVREAGRQLDIVRKAYGNVARMSYNGQTAAITNIVQDLEGQYAQYVQAAGLGGWVVELKARNVTFANLMRDRAYESSQKNLTVLKEARMELDRAFYAILRHLEALVEVEGLAAYEQFILQLNVHIEKFNLFLAHSSNKSKKEEEEEEDTQTDEGSNEN